jgi:putative methyltransferase (TIGR04325 family)
MSLKDFVPPILPRLLAPFRRGSQYGWFGRYSSWGEAQADSLGYDAQTIVEKVKEATLKVRDGKVAYERDSVTFDRIEYSWPLLSTLMWVAARHQGVLKVLDFGGSLGSTYFQNRKFLTGLPAVTWDVVEQGQFVEIGRKALQNQTLHFYQTVDEAIADHHPDVYLFCCVLQYLEKPYDHLKEILSHRPECVVIDNMPFNPLKGDRLTVQRVPPEIYKASYPCWFLDRSKFLGHFEQDYVMIEPYTSELFIWLDGTKVRYEGFLFQRKDLYAFDQSSTPGNT